ncbi:MAG: hypothetical protein JOY84_11565 [Curvibacter sp.]|nr:hypothetical protein [Curvibacter sp.]
MDRHSTVYLPFYQINRMQGFRAVVVLLLSLFTANGVLWFVLIQNQEAGIYPPEADSLSIPIIDTALISLLIFGALGAEILLPKTSRLWIFIRSIPAALSIMFSLALAVSWADLNHYLVSMAFWGVFALCVWASLAGKKDGRY